MSNFKKKIEIPDLSSQEIFNRINEHLQQFSGPLEWLKKSGTKITPDSNAKTFSLGSKIFVAEIVCGEGCIEIEARLSLFALAFKGKLDQSLQSWVNQLFRLGKKN